MLFNLRKNINTEAPLRHSLVPMMPRVDGTETGSLSEFTGAVAGRHNPTKTQLKKNKTKQDLSLVSAPSNAFQPCFITLYTF